MSSLIFVFLFGMIVGSFANVFVLRHGTGRSIGGRSSCAACGKCLSWLELVPVVSYLIQRGRCTACGSRISMQYPIVELLFGGIFVAIAYSLSALSIGGLTTYGLFELAYLWTVSFLLISIAVYDLKHMIIPDKMVYALIAVTLIWNISTTSLQLLIAGPVVALPLFLLWQFSKGRWIGFGDVKLALAMGWLLGIVGGLSAFVFGVWIGAVAGIAIVLGTRLVSRRKGLTMKSAIPFGPFLVAGTFIVLLTGITLEVFL